MQTDEKNILNGEEMKKAFISGILGQDGAYLAEFLLKKGYQVYGGSRRNSQDELYRLQVLGIENEINLVPFDLLDADNVFETISDGQFDEFYNLAAQSFVGTSWATPILTSNTDAMGPLYVLDAIKRSSAHTKFYQASTSGMFGLIQEPRQSDSTPFYPRSPYGVAKLFAHSMTVNYRESYGLHASSGILFNHESPLRGVQFVTKKITTQLSEISLGKRDIMFLGNLDSKRDWGYAKEYVEGMWQMLQLKSGDDFVLASGKTSSVREFVNKAAERLDLQLEWDGENLNEKAYVKSTGKQILGIDEKFYRPAEVDVLLGNPKKAKDILGWESQTDLADLAKIMVKFDYDRISKS